MSRSLFLALLSLLCALIFSQLFFFQLEGHKTVSLAVRAASMDHITAEFMALAAFLVLLVNGRWYFRLSAYLLLILLVVLNCVQYASMLMTGDYLGPLALDNARHVGLVLNPSRIVLALALGGMLLTTVAVTERFFRPVGFGRTLLLATACLLVAVILKTDQYWLDKDVRKARAYLQQTGYNGIGLLSPLQVFGHSLRVSRQSFQEDDPLSSAEIDELASVGISYDPGSHYPLIKDFIYDSELPFASAGNGPDTHLNLIVFLSEGLSARVVQPYSEAYPGLTPNIEAFAESAMRVDNYYNHTFATYRGLLGQLCSIFPRYAGGRINPDTEYNCLGDLLGEEGYKSYFLFSQQRAKTKLDELLLKANIDQVLAQEDLQQLYLQGAAAGRPLALSDQQFLEAATAHLRLLETRQLNGAAPPFFLGLYNIETHAYYHASEDGVEYTEHDSYILDSIHNYDDAFGKFWAYFKSSGLYRNTIVVFTTDHAHFFGKDFVELVNNQADYKPVFVDKIPLLIYHPEIELPSVYDANFASSIDLAPTIAHLMKLPNRPNAFLGRSIFDRVGNESLAWGEGHVYLISPAGIEVQSGISQQMENEGRNNRLYKGINAIHGLEIKGRIWKGEQDE